MGTDYEHVIFNIQVKPTDLEVLKDISESLDSEAIYTCVLVPSMGFIVQAVTSQD